MRFGFLLPALLIVAVGCSGSAKTAKKPSGTMTPTNPSASASTGGVTPPSAGSDPKADVARMRETMKQANKGIRPAPRLTNGWLASKLKAEDVVAAAEKKMAGLKSTSAETTTQVDIEGAVGMSISRVSIKDPSHFSIEYPRPYGGTNAGVQKQLIVGDGTSYATYGFSDAGWSPKKPLANFKAEDKAKVDDWVLTSNRLLFSAVQGGKPFSNLIADARAKGMDVSVEERTIQSPSRKVHQYRVLMTRKPAEAKRLGPLEYEIAIDDFFKMPVTLRAHSAPPNKEPTSIMWTVRWNFATSQTFPDETFKIGSPSAPAKPTKV